MWLSSLQYLVTQFSPRSEAISPLLSEHHFAPYSHHHLYHDHGSQPHSQHDHNPNMSGMSLVRFFTALFSPIMKIEVMDNCLFDHWSDSFRYFLLNIGIHFRFFFLLLDIEGLSFSQPNTLMQGTWTRNKSTTLQKHQAAASKTTEQLNHTWYLSFFLHSHILSHENFTLGKCVNLRQICPATKQLSVELHTVECKTTHRMYHYTYIYPSDVKLHAKGEIKHQV